MNKEGSSSATATPENAEAPAGEEKPHIIKVKEVKDPPWLKTSREREAAKARFDTLNENLRRQEERLDAETSQERLEEMRQAVKNDRQEYVRLTLELWRKGGLKELEPNDLTLIAEDIAEMGVESALAELMLTRHGFKNAQEMLRQLKLNEASVKDLTVKLGEESGLQRFWRSPAVKEQLKKLTVSGGISAGAAGLIAIAGGPISWTTLGLGLAGAATGRAAGEAIRSRMLAKKTKAESGQEVKFKERVARDLLELVVSMQRNTIEILEDEEATPNNRAAAIIQLVRRATAIESRSQKDYQKMERRARYIKSGLSILGAVGGALVGGAITQGMTEAKVQSLDEETKQAFESARESGIRIFHDVQGQAHLALDESQGHIVKQTVDEAWRYVIEQKDTSAWHEMATSKGEWVKEFYHYYVSPEQALQYNMNLGVDNIVPDTLPEGELLHSGTIDEFSITSAINEKYGALIDSLRASDFWARWLGGGLAVATTAGTEYVLAKKEAGRRESIERDDRALLDSIEEVEEMLRGRVLLPWQVETAVGKLPKDPTYRRKFFEHLADFYKVNLPENPPGYYYDWNEQPKVIGDKKILDKVDYWHLYQVDKSGGEQALIDHRSGKVITAGILGVDYENNRIAIVYEQHHQPSGAYLAPVKIIPLHEFLTSYRLHIVERRGEPLEQPKHKQRSSPRLAESEPEERPADAVTSAPKPPREDSSKRKPESRSGRSPSEKLRLPNDFDRWVKSEFIDWAEELPRQVDYRKWEAVGGEVGDYEDEKTKVRFVRFLDRDGSEKILTASRLSSASKVKYEITKRHPNGHISTHFASRRSIEGFIRQLLWALNQASSETDRSQPSKTEEMNSEKRISKERAEGVIERKQLHTEDSVGDAEEIKNKAKTSQKRDLPGLKDRPEKEGPDKDPNHKERTTSKKTKPAEQTEPSGNLTDSLVKFLEKRELNNLDNIEDLLGSTVTIDKNKSEFWAKNLRQLFSQESEAGTINLKITKLEPMLDSEGDTHNYMVTLSDTSGKKEIKIQLTNLFTVMV